jgi:lipoprotein-releasing system ATP-binding protein
MSKARININTSEVPVLECRQVVKIFSDVGQELHVLAGLDFVVRRGDQIAIMGRSGSGKTTLLQILGGLDDPTHGQVFLNGQNFKYIDSVEKDRVRNQSIGFVYQLNHLLPEFSALENVAMPLLIAGQTPKVASERATEILEAVGLKDRLAHRSGKLSGGERQRVAIARALVNEPDCVLADEPTGNLDAENAKRTFEILQSLHRQRDTTLIIVTHDHELADLLDQTYQLVDGKLVLV